MYPKRGSNPVAHEQKPTTGTSRSEGPKYRSAGKPDRVWALFVATAIVSTGVALMQGSGQSPVGANGTLGTSLSPSPSPSQTAAPTAAPEASATSSTQPTAKARSSHPSSKAGMKPAPGASATIPPSAIENPKIAPPVKKAVAGFITKAGQISAAPLLARSPNAPQTTPPAMDFSQVAVGAALGGLEAQAQEFASNGWQQSGSIKVVGEATISKLSTDGQPQVAVTVCVDSSAVTVVDDSGASVLAAAPQGTRKNLNIYTVQDVSGTWLVANHTFPNKTAC